MTHARDGFALITALLMVVVLGVMATAYFFLTQIEMSSTASSLGATTGFYAAEGGLNLRGQTIREEFTGFNLPAGTSPQREDADGNAVEPCVNGNDGSGDLGCIPYQVGSRETRSYVVADENNPLPLSSIPDGDYAGLSAQEYRYTVYSEALNSRDEVEARLEMIFRSRLVPLFQFAAFFKDDLEIGNGPAMTLRGRVHSNGNIYFAPQNSLSISGKVSSAGSIYNGRKDGDAEQNNNSCDGAINIPDRDGNVRNLDITANACTPVARTDGSLEPWGDRVQQRVDALTIPKTSVLDPKTNSSAGGVYWQKADLRVVLRLNNNGTFRDIQVQNENGTNNAPLTNALNGCSGTLPNPDATAASRAVATSNSFYSNRESKYIRMLEVDMKGVLTCLSNNPGIAPSLADDTEGGLVFHFSVDGPNAAGINNYGVRIRNARELKSGASAAPQIKGLTVVTNQALYTQGDYNSDNKKPAAFLSDSLNVLSNDWCDVLKNKGCHNAFTTSQTIDANSGSSNCKSDGDRKDSGKDCFQNAARNLDRRVVTQTTTINAAMLAGVDITGAPGKQGNGGLHNFPRMHEKWSGQTLRIRGSFVSLDTPKHVNGAWATGNQYAPPGRDWDYDTDFNNAARLPPLSPRFVYLVQELFLRDFEQEGSN